MEDGPYGNVPPWDSPRPPLPKRHQDRRYSNTSGTSIYLSLDFGKHNSKKPRRCAQKCKMNWLLICLIIVLIIASCLFLFIQVRDLQIRVGKLEYEIGNLHCPYGWFPAGNSCMITVDANVTWEECRSVCNGMGSTMLNIKQNKTYDAALSHAPPQGVWIGLSKNGSNWKWPSGTFSGTWEHNHHKSNKQSNGACGVLYKNGTAGTDTCTEKHAIGCQKY